MKCLTKLLACAMVFVMMFSLCAAASASEDAVTYDLADCADQVKLVGRTIVTENGIVPQTTAAGIAFYSDCSGDIELTVSGGDGYCTQFAHQYFVTYVDGEFHSRTELKYIDGKKGKDTLTVASDLEAGMHRIEVLRETEEINARCVFEKLTLNGTLQPVADATMLIEFVGDSLTAGYGSYPATEETNALAVDDPIREAGTQTYAYLTAAALGMDVQTCCTSGYGIVAGFNPDDANLQKMYAFTAYHNNHDANDESAFWPFERTADIVVINLGDNDKDTHKSTDEEVGEGIENLMKQVREKNPGSKIVWVTGMSGVNYQPQIEAAIETLGGADEGYYFCILPKGTSGGAGHPDLDEHKAAADVLVDFLKSDVLGDEYVNGQTTAKAMARTLSLAKLIPGCDTAVGEAELAAFEASDAEVSGTMTTVHRALREKVTLGLTVAGAALVLLVLGLILFAVLYTPKKPAVPEAPQTAVITDVQTDKTGDSPEE